MAVMISETIGKTKMRPFGQLRSTSLTYLFLILIPVNKFIKINFIKDIATKIALAKTLLIFAGDQHAD